MKKLINKKQDPYNYNRHLYALLGITSSATPDIIRKAYKKKANYYHPDKYTGNEAMFKAVGSAYTILSDPTTKQDYDLFGVSSVEDIKTAQAAREGIAVYVDECLNKDSLDLEHFDIVKTIHIELMNNKNTLVTMLMNNQRKHIRLTRNMRRAKSSLIKDVFEKNINKLNAQRDRHNSDIAVLEMALKIIDACEYDFNIEKPTYFNPRTV